MDGNVAHFPPPPFKPLAAPATPVGQLA